MAVDHSLDAIIEGLEMDERRATKAAELLDETADGEVKEVLWPAVQTVIAQNGIKRTRKAIRDIDAEKAAILKLNALSEEEKDKALASLEDRRINEVAKLERFKKSEAHHKDRTDIKFLEKLEKTLDEFFKEDAAIEDAETLKKDMQFTQNMMTRYAGAIEAEKEIAEQAAVKEVEALQTEVSNLRSGNISLFKQVIKFSGDSEKISILENKQAELNKANKKLSKAMDKDAPAFDEKPALPALEPSNFEEIVYLLRANVNRLLSKNSDLTDQAIGKMDLNAKVTTLKQARDGLVADNARLIKVVDKKAMAQTVIKA